MDQSRYKLGNIWLDARRALWLPEQQLLAVADAHLGYSWVQRSRGQLLPLTPDDTAERLFALQQQYQPRQVVLVGDVVHGAASIPALVGELRQLLQRFEATGAELILVLGNHDQHLAKLLEDYQLPAQLRESFSAGSLLFIHGDKECRFSTKKADRIVMGHEHPAIRLGDGVTSSMKYPCFLVSDDVIVLPAFSTWAAGTPYGSYPFMSPIATTARFTAAVAIVGERLLAVPLD